MGFRFGAAVAAYRISRGVSRSGGVSEGRLFLSAADHLNYCRISRRWHMGDHSHSHSHHHHHHLGGKGGDGVFKLGLAADVALAAGKGLAGYLSGSTAVIADAAHSVSDIVSSVPSPEGISLFLLVAFVVSSIKFWMDFCAPSAGFFSPLSSRISGQNYASVEMRDPSSVCVSDPL